MAVSWEISVKLNYEIFNVKICSRMYVDKGNLMVVINIVKNKLKTIPKLLFPKIFCFYSSNVSQQSFFFPQPHGISYFVWYIIKQTENKALFISWFLKMNSLKGSTKKVSESNSCDGTSFWSHIFRLFHRTIRYLLKKLTISTWRCTRFDGPSGRFYNSIFLNKICPS